MVDPDTAEAWRLLADTACREVAVCDRLIPEWSGQGIHRHSIPSVVIPLAGCSLLDLASDRILPLTPGAVVLVAPWVWHAHRQPYASGITLILGRIGAIADVELWRDQRVWYGELPWAAVDAAVARVSSARTPGGRLRAGAGLLAALAAHEPVPRQVPVAVDRMSTYVWRMRTQRITAAQVLAASGLSYSVAHDLFVDRFGETPKQYLLRTRLELARALLGSGVPLSAAWGEAGFASRADLSRRFRLAFGCSPRAWLRRR